MILTQFEHEDQSHLIDVIREKGIEGKAGVLGTSFATEYRPWRAGSDVFEKVRIELTKRIREIMGDDDLWVSRDLWGLDYEDDEYTCPHKHVVAKLNAVWYLQADEGSGKLNYVDPDIVITPRTNMLVIASADWTHFVTANEKSNVLRTCIPMNIHSMKDIRSNTSQFRFINNEGQYQLD